MSKKSKGSIFNSPYVLLAELRYGVTSLADICEICQMRKQNARYWLAKICKEGFVEQPSKGLYRLTKSGKEIYDQYERFKGKQLIRIENMHVSFPILEGAEKLFETLVWRRSKLRNDVEIYTGRIENHTVRLILGKTDKTMEVIVTKVLHVDLNRAYHNAIIEAESVAARAQWRTKIEFGEAYVSGKPEIAIPSPIASALLTTTGASQIRINKGIMNRSKGRGADWEVTDLQQAQKIVDMPDVIQLLVEKVTRMEELLRLNSGSFDPIAGNLYRGFF